MSSDDIAQSVYIYIYICTICHFRYPSYNHLANSRDNERVIHDQAATLLGFLIRIPLLTYSIHLSRGQRQEMIPTLLPTSI